MLVEFCTAKDLYIGSTYFQKTPSQRVTFKEAGVSGGPPWSPERFAQIDVVLVPHRWKNCLLDVASSPDVFFDSDHILVTAKVRIKRKQVLAKNTVRKTFCPPTVTEIAAYNNLIAEQMLVQDGGHAHNIFDTIRKVAQTHFRNPPEGRR